jgi:hypothetical protein
MEFDITSPPAPIEAEMPIDQYVHEPHTPNELHIASDVTSDAEDSTRRSVRI